MISVMDRTIELGLKKKTIILGLELCVRFGHRREKSSYKINIKTFFLLKENVTIAVVKLHRRFEMKRDIFLGVFP